MEIDLVQAPSQTRDMLTLTLELTFATKVRQFDRIEDLIALVNPAVAAAEKRDISKVKIIDCSGPAFPDVSVLVKASQGAPVILVHENVKLRVPDILGGCRVADRDKMPDSLVDAINALIDEQALVLKPSFDTYVRVRLELLLQMESLKGDLYIRLNETKYIKILHDSDGFETADFQKYKNKGVEYLYMRTLDCEGFIVQFKQFIGKSLKMPELTFDDASRTFESVHEVVRALSKSIGFTAPVQDLIKIQVMATVKLIEKTQKLADILAKIEELPGSYLSAHSQLTAYIACGIASQMQWGSENTFIKLNLAAFLHDITLDNDRLAEESSLKMVDASTVYTDEEKAAFRNHPNAAAEIAKQFTAIPPDVDVIISQHHELPDGGGFPRGTTAMFLSPLTTVFIVAHDMAKQLIAKKGRFDHDFFVAAASLRYKSSAFKPVLNVVSNMRFHTKK